MVNFDRGINAGNINQVINNYNTNVAGQATPAGKTLISNGLMTLAQLQALGGVAQPIANAPANQVDFSWLRALDLRVAWRHTFKERFTFEPSVGVFNLFNFANFNLPPDHNVRPADRQSGCVERHNPNRQQCRLPRRQRHGSVRSRRSAAD